MKYDSTLFFPLTSMQIYYGLDLIIKANAKLKSLSPPYSSLVTSSFPSRACLTFGKLIGKNRRFVLNSLPVGVLCNLSVNMLMGVPTTTGWLLGCSCLYSIA